MRERKRERGREREIERPTDRQTETIAGEAETRHVVCYADENETLTAVVVCMSVVLYAAGGKRSLSYTHDIDTAGRAILSRDN